MTHLDHHPPVAAVPYHMDNQLPKDQPSQVMVWYTPVPHAPHTMVPPMPYMNQAAIDQNTTSCNSFNHGTTQTVLYPIIYLLYQLHLHQIVHCLHQVQEHPFKQIRSPKAETGKELNKHLQVNKRVIRQNQFVGDASRQVISSGTAQCHHTAPNVGKKATFWLNVPKRTKGLVYHNHQQDNHNLQWTHSFSSVFTARAITGQLFAQNDLNINCLQALQVTCPVQVSNTLVCLPNRAPRTASQQQVSQHRPYWSTTLHEPQDTTQVTILHKLPLR